MDISHIQYDHFCKYVFEIFNCLFLYYYNLLIFRCGRNRGVTPERPCQRCGSTCLNSDPAETRDQQRVRELQRSNGIRI